MHCAHPLSQTGEPRQLWWFGGGADLTPSYLFPEDAEHFHVTHKGRFRIAECLDIDAPGTDSDDACDLLWRPFTDALVRSRVRSIQPRVLSSL